MENGGVDITVINSRQHKIGQMADFPPLVAYSFFKFQEHEVPQIESETMQNTLIHTFQQIRQELGRFFLEITVIKQSKLLTNINNKSHLHNKTCINSLKGKSFPNRFNWFLKQNYFCDISYLLIFLEGDRTKKF